ncbi:MAG: hypothetical protein JWQ21_3088 [Herminiimonas sp.]|nr:hypothetical protein [Herminiimonas sp.]
MKTRSIDACAFSERERTANVRYFIDNPPKPPACAMHKPCGPGIVKVQA